MILKDLQGPSILVIDIGKYSRKNILFTITEEEPIANVPTDRNQNNNWRANQQAEEDEENVRLSGQVRRASLDTYLPARLFYRSLARSFSSRAFKSLSLSFLFATVKILEYKFL